MSSTSDATSHHHHDDDEHHQAGYAARPIAPASAVRPRGQGAHQREDQNDQENHSQGHDIAPFPGLADSRFSPAPASVRSRTEPVCASVLMRTAGRDQNEPHETNPARR